jgi:hypothetical protein
MGRKPLGPWVVVGVDGSADASAAVELAAEATMRGLQTADCRLEPARPGQ